MKRAIIHIDEEKCNGCGLCISARHEGALQLVDGKARLILESYCDGLGDCLPECPKGAITLEERDAAEYDEEAVKARTVETPCHSSETLECGCPGSQTRTIHHESTNSKDQGNTSFSIPSQLRQWPVQIKLVPTRAPFFNNARLLVAADCTAYAYAGIHTDFIRDRITIIGCPKLDMTDYTEKLSAIIKNNDIRSITVLKMEVPCCSGLSNSVRNAMVDSGKYLPWNVVTVTTDGQLIES
ncbi:MAG: 4Fe-4S binding protein [Clostridia bacterium]|nr:4Fe-4S binding protein [Clostridia bacterium]